MTEDSCPLEISLGVSVHLHCPLPTDGMSIPPDPVPVGLGNPGELAYLSNQHGYVTIKLRLEASLNPEAVVYASLILGKKKSQHHVAFEGNPNEMYITFQNAQPGDHLLFLAIGNDFQALARIKFPASSIKKTT